ncbi:MAG: hypothetical protein V1661_02395 [bacterium]
MLNYNKIYLILSTVIGINLFFSFLPKPALFVLGSAMLVLAAFALGSKKEPDADIFTKICFGVLWLAIPVALVGAVFFYFFALGKLAILTSLFIIFLQTKDAEIRLPKLNFKSLVIGHWGLVISYLLIASTLFYILIKYQSDSLIKSPWLSLPSFFLPLFFLGTALLIFLLNKKKIPAFPLRPSGFAGQVAGMKSMLPAALYFFIFFSIAAFVYNLGYGFDQFVHEASQKYILAHGTITPKTLQYIGFYGINIFLNRVAGIPIEILDKFLLPALTALVPAIAYYSFKKQGQNISPIASLALLFLPLSYFIVSTPQGLANLLLLILILLGKNYKNWALPLTILLIHPLTGIIAITYQAFVKLRFKKIIATTGALALPLAFIVLSYQYSGRLYIGFNFLPAIKDYGSLLTFGGLQKNYNLFLDIFYLMRCALLPAVSAISVFTAIKYKKNINLAHLYFFGITTASFFLTRIFANFSYLITYEQKNYPERIFYISLLFLSPYLILAAQKFYEKITSPPFQGGVGGGFVFKLFFAALFAFALTANFYFTYPRWDNYQNDKGKNLTSDMLLAVEAVQKDAGEKNYIVLTDQAVSSGALKLYGFKKYYKTPLGEIFYYPIPTGGPLYNEFLNLVYNNAGAKSAENAKILTGAETAYVVLPSYWENYKKIKEKLLLQMQPIFENENVVILKY